MTEPSLPEESLFLQALEMPSAAERTAYLDRACGEDRELRAAVEALLRAHDQSGDLLDLPEQPTATVDESPLPERAGTVIGPYKLLEEIGEGGMGTVWVAQQTEPIKRLVAVKLIKPGMDSKAVLARFEAERQALALMDHPNIAKVHDAGTTTDGAPFFVMELVKGVPITRYCDEHRLTPRQRLELFVPVCQAVQHAHQKGIIHRDLKPSNVLVALYDDRPVPKVIDFGVAKATGQQLTEQSRHTGFGAVVGTVEYMSPEQASFNQLDVDTRSDIYSLGVLLYELLTGTTPFDKKRLQKAPFDEILRIIREEEPPKPSARLSTTPELASVAASRGLEPKQLSGLVRGELDWIVMKCLEKDRNRRYETANGLAMDLQHYLADEPVSAGPPSAWYRLRKFLRRNKGPVLAVLLVTLALVGGVAVSTWQAVRAVSAREQAIANEAKALGEKRKAEQSEADAKAVLVFFADKVLAAARPREMGGGLGVNATIQAAVDAAEPQVAGTFKDQPLVEASVRHTLGDTYLSLRKAKLAIRQLERALELFRALRGPEDDETLGTMNDLAEAYRQAGQLEEAIRMAEQEFELRKVHFGSDHATALTSMNNLARAYQDAGRYEKAVVLYEECLEKRRAKFGPDDEDTLAMMGGLGMAYRSDGRLDRAIPLFEQTLERKKAKLPRDHPSTLTTLDSLAGAYIAADRLADGLPLYEQALKLRQSKLGPDHPDTLLTMSRLAVAYQTAGRPGEAERLLREYLTIREKKFPDDWLTFDTMSRLGGALLEQKKYADAEPLLLSGYEGLKARDAKIPTNSKGSLTAALTRLVQHRPQRRAVPRPGVHDLGRPARARGPAVRRGHLPAVLRRPRGDLVAAAARQRRRRRQQPVLPERERRSHQRQSADLLVRHAPRPGQHPEDRRFPGRGDAGAAPSRLAAE
jgi:serine/threonine protein kinase